ncbi:MAG: hypothetical protein IPO04_05850 [Cytophagaceae bacterium]|nr:hypothetical protein [Cytophagaceae bacterium]
MKTAILKTGYGVRVGVGVAMEKLQFGINYNYGLANIAPVEMLTINSQIG